MACSRRETALQLYIVPAYSTWSRDSMKSLLTPNFYIYCSANWQLLRGYQQSGSGKSAAIPKRNFFLTTHILPWYLWLHEKVFRKNWFASNSFIYNVIWFMIYKQKLLPGIGKGHNVQLTTFLFKAWCSLYSQKSLAWDQARSHGGHSGAVPPNIFISPRLCYAKKIFLNI